MFYHVPDKPKMLRETFCIAQSLIGNSKMDENQKQELLDRLQRLIDECDYHRPLDSKGEHGNKHTSTCGCEY